MAHLYRLLAYEIVSFDSGIEWQRPVPLKASIEALATPLSLIRSSELMKASGRRSCSERIRSS